MNRHNSEEVRQLIADTAVQLDTLMESNHLNGIRFTFVAPSEETFNELSKIIHEVENLGHTMRVLRGSLHDFKEIMDAQDFIVTAGNSYGHMTGGLDGALADIYPDLIKRVPSTIALKCHGELNVGDGVLVHRHIQEPIYEKIVYKDQYLVYVPTMRTPRRLAKGSDVPYLATHKALSLIRQGLIQHPTFRNVFMTLMGTGTGNIPVKVAVEQFLLALRKATRIVNVKKLFDDGKDVDHELVNIWKRYGNE
ncbi:hypothetical protein AVT69_gp269 [Pseudomonas phage PhiPA3]|uniref:Uncharacterized protein 271 n=1 Tax=Pseudomonas phage PhiPA3 TaxID=998086 RepID=F8SJA8_BPPA3|nr:hypothetical protein AVT69_gp269 [Pseudomonas phage PhiPA3]AEH03694.1 hypothetical protein [Pseudomonas phage PhiPA3]